MTQQTDSMHWDVFHAINQRRRAIRDFESRPISEEDVRDILAEAICAPSSGNLQPYQLHWIRHPALKTRIAETCNGQRAAASAPTLIVVTASTKIARITAEQQRAHIEASQELPDATKAYYRKQSKMFFKILNVGSWHLWTPFVALIGLFIPSLSLLPIGHMGSRAWAARNAAFAAQTLMLAASAKGIDSCPMEGFSAPKLAKVLGLARGTVVPVVIALGYRSENARIEQQWRRSLSNVLIEH